jgi:predicted Fe-Mo cluster-binding NifX family protein/Fe-S-cluster containining protein
MTPLIQIQETVRLRVEAIAASYADWPCRKGCDECCRRLAESPRVTEPEWELILAALEAMPPESAERLKQRIRDSAVAARPVVCPLLNEDEGTCLVYEARPVACRAYGFYAEREWVLGCGRIETKGREAAEVVWGNHAALEERIRGLGRSAPIAEWLAIAAELPHVTVKAIAMSSHRIALATADGFSVADHLARSTGFVVLDIENSAVQSRSLRNRASEACGNHATFVEMLEGCGAVICGGIGAGAWNSLTANGIRPIVLAGPLSLEDAAAGYLAGTLATTEDRVCLCH